MSSHAGRNSSFGTILWIVIAVLLPFPWLVQTALGGLHFVPEVAAPATGLAILGAAFLLSWSTELAEKDIPQSLALLILALVSVLPEYAVDLTFAIKAAENPEWTHYAVANMTGANRLLIGLGWSSVVLVSCWRRREHELSIPVFHRLEMKYLIYSTIYSFFIPLREYLPLPESLQGLNIFDALVLFALFIAYARSASRGHREEVEHEGPAAWIEERTRTTSRRVVAVAALVYATAAIFFAAEPFAESLVELGHHLPIDEFVLVQWVAPLASESPEFMVALMFAWKLRGHVGIGTLISSKVNQWTLLVGALPVAFAAASGELIPLPLDARQTEELFLTSAQSLLAAMLIVDLEFSRLEAVLLAAAFSVQLFFTEAAVRTSFALLYLFMFFALMVASPDRRAAFFASLRH
ncbi:MAG TPA: sodium:proton exchanger, partial [Myxococcota bacterium]|nr:sodium:proton exchanger [Myxococcota bacterium]